MEGYGYPSSAFMNLEGSYSYDEEDDPEGRQTDLDIADQVKMTLKQFYAGLGDLTAPKRQQPGASAFEAQMGSLEASVGRIAGHFTGRSLEGGRRKGTLLEYCLGVAC